RGRGGPHTRRHRGPGRSRFGAGKRAGHHHVDRGLHRTVQDGGAHHHPGLGCSDPDRPRRPGRGPDGGSGSSWGGRPPTDSGNPQRATRGEGVGRVDFPAVSTPSPTGARSRRGPFRVGDKVQLTDPKGRLTTLVLEQGKSFHTHRGYFAHDDLIGKPEGSVVTTNAGV